MLFPTSVIIIIWTSKASDDPCQRLCLQTVVLLRGDGAFRRRGLVGLLWYGGHSSEGDGRPLDPAFFSSAPWLLM